MGATADLKGTIAIIGMVGRFPGARNLEELWQNLRGGVESVRFFTEEELLALGVPAARLADPGYVKAAAQPADIDRFDAPFFGINPREAEILDPQQRLFLEAAWEALETAGYDPESAGEVVGVFAGATLSTYLLFHLLPDSGLVEAVDPLQLLVGNAGDSLATRVSYKLNLQGPSLTVQSACSTSLLAVHLACQSLLNGECDLALAGGVSLNTSLLHGYRRQEGSVFSAEGRCRAFDAGAQGILFGGGLGIVVLKRCEEALADGDTIQAVIRGSAVNNDGGLKVGYTAPSVEGQAQVIAEALAVAGVPAESLGYVEAHGTGTRLGDPIEIQALTKAFRAETAKRGFCALGSVKTNIGHLDVAAGVAGLIKTVLSLRHRQIVPSLHFAEPNPEIDFAASPVYVNTELREWESGEGVPRRAGVSSFGFGGTNVHVVLEEAPARPASSSSPGWHALPLAAKSETALARMAEQLADHLERHPELELADVAHTLQVGRSAFAHRRVVVARHRAEAVAALRGGGSTGERGRAEAGEIGGMAGRWLAGEAVGWSALSTAGEGGPRRRVPLPTYPFERQSYWIAPPGGARLPSMAAPATAVRELHPRPRLFNPYVAPRDALERRVAAIWEEILGVEPVGAHDSFFELGGHSLLATQVLSRVRDAFGVDFPLQQLFSFPTAAELAEAIRFLQQERSGEVGREAPAAPGGAHELADAQTIALRPRSPAPPSPGPLLPPIVRVSRQGDLPLSFAQERLWFVDQLEPDSSLYVVPIAFRVSGELSVVVLARVLGEVFRRHEALRTVFREEGGRARQVVLASAALAVAVVDLTNLGPASRESAMRDGLAQEARRPFDLAAGPLVRARLWRLGEREHALLLAFHHIVSDGWSLGVVLVREVKALYPAFAAGRASPLPDLPFQYADFAVWQRGWLAGGVLAAQIAHWRERLSGAPPLELPADRPRPRVASSRGAVEKARLPLASDLHDLARRSGTTLFMVLLAGYQTLLGRHAGQDDFLVGTPIANRHRSELEGLFGLFVNALALRADLAGDPPFGALLDRVRAAALAAYAHQDAPFDKLVEALAPERYLSRAPLFQAMFTLQNLPAVSIRLPGLAMEALDLPPAGAELDLGLSVVESGEILELALLYRTDLLAPVRAKRLLSHLAALLAGAVAEPGRRLADLPLLAAGELHQLLREWPAGGAGTRLEGCLHDRFADRAARVPQAPALVWEGGELAYGDVERRANQLARRLRQMGVGPEVVVALLLPREWSFVVSILAVWKAGGAYLPLDPETPVERLRYLLADSGAAVLVAAAEVGEAAAGLVGFGEGPVPLWLDAEWPRLAKLPGHRVDAGAGLDGLAYVLYTSGSTGRPKGVLVPHRGLANVVRHAAAALCVRGEGDRVLHNSSWSFDASVLETFLALSTGAALCLSDARQRASGGELAGWMRRQRVSTAILTPAVLAQLLEPGPAGGGRRVPELPALRSATVGGERCPSELAAAWSGAVRLSNCYGPTEATIYALEETLDPENLSMEGPAIGRPLPGMRAYLCAARLEPLPPGSVGELCLGGVGVARGYLGRPDLTAERFVPDPWSGHPGGRLYRTGDLASHLPDGRLRFVGRADQQVKLRGVRIELEEIEAVLLRHPALREAVVVAETDPPRLVALVVPRDGSAGIGLPALLRAFLVGELPAAMVPAEIVALPELPRTRTGKLDRRQASALASRRPAPRPESAARPLTPAEELLTEIWAEVLGRGDIEAEDNFFALGGHSLLATQAMSRIRDIFAVELPVRVLFESPTLAELAARLGEARYGALPLSSPGLTGEPRPELLPLSFAQERLWFLDRLTPGLAAYNLPIAVQLAGALSPAAFAGALRALVERHEVLRTRFADDGGRPVQVITPAAGIVLPLAVVDLRALPGGEAGAPDVRGAEAARRLDAEAMRPFDLRRGPLVRIHLLRLDDALHLLLVNLHHIVADGWSLGVLTRELGALLRGEELPPLPVQYADFVLWQRRWLTGKVLERQLDYWRGQLAGLPALELPTDRRRPVEQSHRGGVLDVELPRELATALAALARESRGVTLFMVLLAGFAALLGRYSGQDDVALGTIVANRNRREIEGLIGIFVNTLVLRADLSRGASFAELVALLREVTLGAYGHQDLPFEKLVEELRPDRDTRRAPLVQVSFVLQNTPRVPLELPGLGSAVVPLASRGAKLDLTLSLVEARGALAGDFEYDADLFDRGTIERLAGHFERLLAAAVAAPGVPLAELALLDAVERRQLMADWSRTGTAEGLAPVPVRFARQAAEGSDRPAVLAGDAVVTYGELARRAGLLAGRLRALGVGPEERVGLCLERGAGMVEAVLAVLVAGGAYVPLDPAFPDERLARMLEDAAPRLVLADRRHRARLGAAVALGPDDLPRPGEGAAALPGVAAETAAYVLFTSGSTGRPKGVVVEHRSLAAFLLAMEELELLDPGRTLLAVTTLGFDIAGLELFLPLTTGAAVAVATREQAADGGELIRLVAEHRIGSLQATPATWPLLLAAGFQAEPGFQALAGGEALTADLAGRLLAAGARLTNLYGPTETTIWSAATAVGERHLEGSIVPLGGPIARTGIYVLDVAFEPAPVGVPGEIAIGGAGVARGYLGLPERTAERFVPDPFGAPGGRLYRTGDRGRWRGPRGGAEPGELEFLGRLDHQVKLRGFRIELGEIEATLAAHPGVAEAVVVLRHDPPGEPRLVACWSPAAGAAPEAAELRRACQERLPAYMVPAAFVRLERLPRLPNGKLDRRSLPGPGAAELERPAELAAPESPLEAAVAAVWAEVLGVPKVGMTDDFFADLGGHSLLAAQVISLLRQRLGVELPLRSLFAAPTARGWAAWVAQAVAAEGAPLIRRGDSAIPLPLSHAQERLWFLEQLTPGLSTYNLPLAVGLSGRLDAAALSAAIAAVLARHEALRSRFTLRAGQPVQEVLAPAFATGFILPRIDLTALPAAAGRAEAARLTHGEAARPFDLGTGPLLRARLLDLGGDRGDRRYRLLLTVHHIASDAWSMSVLQGELAALYGGERLPELPVQYGDYTLWQRRQLTAAALAGEIAWWRRELEGLPTLALPADHPRPRLPRHRGGDVFLTLPAEIGAALRHQGRRAGATLFMALLAGFSALLARFSGQSDFAVGTVVANRPRRELEGLIGFFVNTVVLRAGPIGRPSFAEHLERLREVTLGAFSHQELPFARLVEELRPARDTGQTPLVQVLLVLQNAPRPPVEVRGLAMRPEPEERGVALFDLTLQVIEEEGRIGCRFEYDADLFERATVRRLAERWQRLLTHATAEPDRPLATLPWLTPIELQQTVHEWSAGPPAPAPVLRVHQSFEQQAARSPETVAVVDGTRRLTYGELNHQANRLAHALVARDVGPEVRVGLCLERSAELVIGMLAILKAGGAYVPLDPDYPAERLALLRADSGLSLVVSEHTIAERLGIPSGEVVTVPASEAGLGEAPASEDGARLPAPARVSERQRVHEHRPEPSAPPPDPGLAYVIYTSGSTGTPKGVGITQANVATFLAACAEIYPAEWLTGVFAATSIAFDLSVFEILGTLAWGGTLVLARNLFDEAAWDGAWPITLVNTVPSALDKLVEARPLPPTVKTVNLAGEPLPEALAQKLHRRGIPRVINLYAPSETTTYSTCAFVRGGGEAPAIGRPLAGTRVYVLDGEMQPVPQGVEGQIFLGGAGVTRGYLGRPDLTAGRYLPDPFAGPGESGARLYRTGDRGRHRPGGELEYLGRVDQQIKLRGFRIEPGEIEAVLAASPGVREVLVVLREDVPGDRRLVAYVALEEGTPTPTAELLRRCQETLPPHMVPAAFVVLDSLPRLPNGKLDRRALAEKGPAPVAARPEGGRFVAPASALEKTVAAAWQEVLRIDRVGLGDNFFDLGGHSLLAVTLHGKLEERLERRLAIVDLFHHPTVESFARFAARPGDTAAVPLRALEIRASQRQAALAARRPFHSLSGGA